MRSRQARVINRKLLVFLAVALLAATAAMLFSTYRTEPLKEFLVARRDLPSGVAITSANFRTLATDLDGEGLYLSRFEPDALLAQPIRKGQLLPVSVIGHRDLRYSVVLTPSQPLSTSIRVGSLVDVWFVSKPGAGEIRGVPQRIGISLEVLSIVDAKESASFVSDETRLEVATTAEGLAPLMLASAEGGFIGVVTNQ